MISKKQIEQMLRKEMLKHLGHYVNPETGQTLAEECAGLDFN